MIVDLHRKLWVESRYRETVELFHEYRKLPENEHRDLVELSRACAAMVFRVNVKLIVGNRELTAKALMSHMRENIGDEIQKAILETPQVELAC